MASPVGLTVWVKLRGQPAPNDVAYGVVKSLEANSHLTLQNVLLAGSNTRFDEWTIQATAIENLEVIDPAAVPTPLHPPAPSALHHGAFPQHHAQPRIPPQSVADSRVSQFNSAPIELPVSAPVPQKPAFVDPAIVSYGASSPPRRNPPSKAVGAETPIKSMLAAAAASLPSPGSPFIADVSRSSSHKLKDAVQRSPTGRPSVLSSEVAPLESAGQEPTMALAGRKKVRRGQKTKKQPAPNTQEIADPPPIMNSEVSRNGNDMNGNIKRGKGWRSTPLLQPSPHTVNSSDKANTKKSRRKQREEMENDAMGDTTGIEDMAEFDFEGELKKFDKKQVFDEIRQGDTTADEDRLVSHNRARPGTYGGKNLHPTEPVLSPKVQPVYNSNELSSASEADTELNLNNGRSSSKHSSSRTAFSKQVPSRQNSAQIDAKSHPLSASVSSDRNHRSTTSLAHRGKSASLATSSPYPDRANSPHSTVSSSRPPELLRDAPALLTAHFAIQPHTRPCPTLLPRALENLESATVSAFGLSYDALIECAGRCVAEAALQLSDGSPRRPSRANTIRGSVTASGMLASAEIPTIVILAGNHSVGARALAAARHLLGRNYKVIVAEGLVETPDAQDPHMTQQTSILRRMARGGAQLKRGSWKKAYEQIKKLSGPPAVIIDALLAGTTYDSLSSPNAAHTQTLQQETREMIDWANRSVAPVLSVACPSGISGIDGLSTILEGEPLAIRPQHVLALGAPMQGLLQAMENGEKWESTSVADIGINIALKAEEAVAFGASWSVDVRFVAEVKG